MQPVDPLEEWVTPPFEPTVRDGAVYARGSSDNKGNHMAALKAAEYAIAAGGLPVNLRLLIEGEEEIGGQSLPTFVRAMRAKADRLKSDYVLVWDGGFSPEGRPALCTGLRGILYVQLEAQGGQATTSIRAPSVGSRPIPSTPGTHPWRAQDREGRITIPGFYDRVQPPSAMELKEWERPAGYEETFLKLVGAPALEGEPDYPLTQRKWTRPTLDVNGFLGGFTDEGNKTIIPARAMVKVSMRLVPDQDPEQIFEALRAYLQELTTPGVRVGVTRSAAARPALFGMDHPGVLAASAAFQAAFGKPASFIRSGGSVLVALDLKEALGAHMLVSGLAQPGSGAHAPNENFSLDHYHRGIEMLLHVMHGLADSTR